MTTAATPESSRRLMPSKSRVSGDDDAMIGFASARPRYSVARFMGDCAPLGVLPIGLEPASVARGEILVGAIAFVERRLGLLEQGLRPFRVGLGENLEADLAIGVVLELQARSRAVEPERILAPSAQRRVETK